jgi:uncharacterized repeat protein (TIGR03803 family)
LCGGYLKEQCMKELRFVLAVASLFVSAALDAATFQNITNWIGDGTNEAGFEIDWNFTGNTNDALLWGYRWNGAATGEQMLDALCAGDPRLYAEVSGNTQYGTALFGLGLHQSGDQNFLLNPPLAFGTDHLAVTNYNGVDDYRTNGIPGDFWQEGWYNLGYWAYFTSTEARLGADFTDWDYSGVGMTERILDNGDWDGWVFAWNFNTTYPVDPFPGTYVTNNTPHPTLRLVHGFDYTDGNTPASDLVILGNTLYGTASGGSNSTGVLFSVETNGTEFSELIFATNNGTSPAGDLALAGGTLYGTTRGAGFSGNGTVYSVAVGSSTIAAIYNFSATSNLTNFDGANPQCGLTVGDNNTLFGSASEGGIFGSGVLFSLNSSGSNFAILHPFTALDTNAFNADGYSPSIPMIFTKGILYGVVAEGGTGGTGTIFSMNEDGSGYKVLHDFSAYELPARTNADGALPDSPLILANDVLYGVANEGGFYNSGTIFSVGIDGSDFTNLYNFSSDTNGNNSDGAYPLGALVLDSNVLYGVTQEGGQHGQGTVYQINTNGSAFFALAQFPRLIQGMNAVGTSPQAGLIKVGDSLYGTTGNGGPGQGGTVCALDFPAPPLYLTATSNQLSVTWPVWAQKYVLETSTNLSSTNWQPVASGLSGTNFIFNAPIQGESAFFRLKK